MSCARAVQVFLATGSHYLTHADWGCMDGEHRAWIIVEVDNKEQARGIVPPAFRAQARIIALNKFTLEQMQAMIGKHQR
jgi:nicotinate-nucleotide pyrophosphorylase